MKKTINTSALPYYLLFIIAVVVICMLTSCSKTQDKHQYEVISLELRQHCTLTTATRYAVGDTTVINPDYPKVGVCEEDNSGYGMYGVVLRLIK